MANTSPPVSYDTTVHYDLGTQVDTVLPVAASDLVAWYPFRSGTGEDLTAGDSRFGDTTDYSATVNGATFQASGGVTDIKTGAKSGAFEFDGVDDTIDLGTVADSDQSLTVMTWVKPDTVSSTSRRFVTKSSGNAFQDGGIVLDKLSGGRPRLLITINQSVSTATAPTPISANTYTHLTGRYDFQNGTLTIFVNGQPVGNASSGQAPALKTQAWRIGADDPSQGGNFFDGTVDGTRIYIASLSDNQINQIYLNTKP